MTIIRKRSIRRSPLRPSLTPIPRSTTPIARSWIKRKPRPPSAFARIYGSRARVRWVKHQPCVYCLALSPLFGRTDGSSENAHTESGHGTAYKAGYRTIAPLCRTHHRRYDRRLFPFNDEATRQGVKDCAPRIEAAWQAHLASVGVRA